MAAPGWFWPGVGPVLASYFFLFFLFLLLFLPILRSPPRREALLPVHGLTVVNALGHAAPHTGGRHETGKDQRHRHGKYAISDFPKS